ALPIYVAHVVAGQTRVHETGDERVGRRLAIVVHPLHERRGAVTDADDGDSHGSHGRPPGAQRDHPPGTIAAGGRDDARSVTRGVYHAGTGDPAAEGRVSETTTSVTETVARALAGVDLADVRPPVGRG